MLDPETEADIVAGARSPHRATRDVAFERLATRAHAPLLALCVHMTGDERTAVRALERTLREIRAGLPRTDRKVPLGAWIRRVAIRCALHEAARAPRPEPPDPLPRALARLAAPQRAVLALFAEPGAGHEDVASVLGVPVGSVWTRLHAARRRLVELLGTPANPEPRPAPAA